MSDIPNNSFLDELVRQEDELLIENLFGEVYVSAEEEINCSDCSDSDASSVRSVNPTDIFTAICEADIFELVAQLRKVTVHQARREISDAEKALEECQKLLEERNMRHIFRSISLALKTSLSDLDTGLMKKLQILRLNAADRIAVRPIFYRAGYDVQSPDPMVTRAGLPRAISMPEGLSALEDIGSICSLCEEYPEF